jgi:SAM-dependent methyltransferase
MINYESLLGGDQLAASKFEVSVQAVMASSASDIVTMGATAVALDALPDFADSRITRLVSEEGNYRRYKASAFSGFLVDTTITTVEYPNDAFVVDRSGSIPLEDSSQDRIVFSNQFGAVQCHYSEGSPRLFNEAFRVLRPGGYLVSLAHMSSQRSVRDLLTDGVFMPGREAKDGSSLGRSRKRGMLLGSESSAYDKAMLGYGLNPRPVSHEHLDDTYVLVMRKYGDDSRMTDKERELWAEADRLSKESGEIRQTEYKALYPDVAAARIVPAGGNKASISGRNFEAQATKWIGHGKAALGVPRKFAARLKRP